jgi:hypothetical protein
MDALLFLAAIAALALAFAASDAEPDHLYREVDGRDREARTPWQFHTHSALYLAGDRARELREAARRDAMLREREPAGRSVPGRRAREVRTAAAIPLRAVARLAGGASAAAMTVATRIEGRPA